MRRSLPLTLAALAFLAAGTGRGESGVVTANAAARVSVSIPSVHGADVPSAPAQPAGGAALAGNRDRQGARLELPPLRVMSSNGDGSTHLVRRVRDPGAVALSSSEGRRATEREVVSTSSRSGAAGWTQIDDTLEIPAAAASRGPKRVTVIYEVWSF